jgi:NitT/TauT family transport system ATP-binding protein
VTADRVATGDASRLVFRNVSKTFDDRGRSVEALSDVSLDVAPNEFVCLLGPSGCGKSTMLNMAAGLDQPTSGAVLVDDQPVSAPGPERGVIFQQYALFPWLTVRQNVEFGLKIKHLSKPERRNIVDHYISAVGLSDFADALPKTLSGGMKQRCAVARAYAARPKILLMDEPFGALDALTRVQLQDQLLHTWRDERRTVLFITHDVDEAVYLSNRVVVMANRPGRIQRIIDIDLPYPRNEEIRLTPEFSALRTEVWQTVYHQHRGDLARPAAK